ncbi:hypothetical protein TPB0596_11870 [Tsukamurella pulmonis]|uniref:ImmA/IrrE family metallo-endopeptidase n=1 Tax=Tsukamurella pulmonis TaxID=47312 RepID=UPI001EE14154|nr:ImmA/IrrE family metallo-endopeptidase [Tsukamurella pulmonis]BDD81424.1 hypothetical protein TPB0596_11870 [Tsukamurella pulmonis]
MTTTEPTPTWHPWRTLREQYPHVEVRWAQLPDGIDGFTDGRTIWLDERLSQVQRRCTLTHELWHLRRGIIPADDREERICDDLAARELIPLGRLIDGFRWTRDPGLLAKHLWVDMPTLRVRLDNLDPIEVAELEHETNGAWWQ